MYYSYIHIIMKGLPNTSGLHGYILVLLYMIINNKVSSKWVWSTRVVLKMSCLGFVLFLNKS